MIPRQINDCFNCGNKLYDGVNLTYEEDRKYRVYCPNCGQYIEFNASSRLAPRTGAVDIYNAMFTGTILYPIEDLYNGGGSDFVLLWKLPVEQEPTLICWIDGLESDFDESLYTHFSCVQLPRKVVQNGVIKDFDCMKGE